MRLLYPYHPLDEKQADLPYQAEFAAAKAAGFSTSLFDFDRLTSGTFKPRPRIEADEPVLYRGWMLTPERYGDFVERIAQCGGRAITAPSAYRRCHHLPGWYDACAAFTAETHFFDPTDDLEAEAQKLGWQQFFVKDFVKSNTADKGSIASSPADVSAIVRQIAEYRGEIEGGVAIRQVEAYKPGTEQRYFVVHGVPFGVDDTVPSIVGEVSRSVDAPFYSVDVIETLGGGLRVVELGDGQVSDRKSWPLERFRSVLDALRCASQ